MGCYNMLILTRKLNEQIIISENISITILQILNDKVKIGIEAPKEISVYRKELIDGTKEANLESSNISVEAIEKLKKKFKKND